MIHHHYAFERKSEAARQVAERSPSADDRRPTVSINHAPAAPETVSLKAQHEEHN